MCPKGSGFAVTFDQSFVRSLILCLERSHAPQGVVCYSNQAEGMGWCSCPFEDGWLTSKVPLGICPTCRS